MTHGSVADDMSLISTIRNDRSSRRYFWAAAIIAVASLATSFIALLK